MNYPEDKGVRGGVWAPNEILRDDDINFVSQSQYTNHVATLLDMAHGLTNTTDVVISGLIVEPDALMTLNLTSGSAVSATGSYLIGGTWGFVANAGDTFGVVAPVDTAVAITTADPTNPRIDVIEVRPIQVEYDQKPRQFKDPITGLVSTSTIETKIEYGFEFQVLAGTPAASPSAPSKTAGWVKLAEVNVAALATTITGGDIITYADSDTWNADTGSTVQNQNDVAIAQNAADIIDLAGAGRTTETVKGNADAIAATPSITFDEYCDRVFDSIVRSLCHNIAFNVHTIHTITYHPNGILGEPNNRDLSNLGFKDGTFHWQSENISVTSQVQGSDTQSSSGLPPNAVAFSDDGSKGIIIVDNGATGLYSRTTDYGTNWTSFSATNPTFVGGTSSPEMFWKYGYFYLLSSGGTLYRAADNVAPVWTAVTTNATGMAQGALFRVGDNIGVCYENNASVIAFRMLTGADAMGSSYVQSAGSTITEAYASHAPAGVGTPEGYYIFTLETSVWHRWFTTDFVNFTLQESSNPEIGATGARHYLIDPLLGHCWCVANDKLLITETVDEMWNGRIDGKPIKTFAFTTGGPIRVGYENDTTLNGENPGYFGIVTTDGDYHFDVCINKPWQDIRNGDLTIV